VHKLGNWLIDK